MSDNTHDGEVWLTVQTVAEELQCGVKPIYRAIDRGELRAVRLTQRGDIRIRRTSLVDWLVGREHANDRP